MSYVALVVADLQHIFGFALWQTLLNHFLLLLVLQRTLLLTDTVILKLEFCSFNITQAEVSLLALIIPFDPFFCIYSTVTFSTVLSLPHLPKSLAVEDAVCPTAV